MAAAGVPLTGNAPVILSDAVLTSTAMPCNLVLAAFGPAFGSQEPTCLHFRLRRVPIIAVHRCDGGLS